MSGLFLTWASLVAGTNEEGITLLRKGVGWNWWYLSYAQALASSSINETHTCISDYTPVYSYHGSVLSIYVTIQEFPVPEFFLSNVLRTVALKILTSTHTWSWCPGHWGQNIICFIMKALTGPVTSFEYFWAMNLENLSLHIFNSMIKWFHLITSLYHKVTVLSSC